MCAVVALHLREFFGGFCVGWGIVWFGIWMSVCVLLREESAEIGRGGVCLVCAGVVLVCVFFREWVVLVVLRA